MQRFAAWGNLPGAPAADVQRLEWRDAALPEVEPGGSLLPYGLGRSYGDSCLNGGGTLLHTRSLRHLIEFDTEAGLLRCESGTSLAEILELVVPRGWFLPVSPGTKHVTLGGAIANDIHGKNHHRAGTLGRHLTCFELVRSDGSRRICGSGENEELFRATIGGLGLTGLISWAEIRLIPIASSTIERESIRFDGIDDFFELAAESDERFEYTVAWVDCGARGRRLGRGIFQRADFVAADEAGELRPSNDTGPSVPLHAPGALLNPLSIRLFNELWYRKQLLRSSRRRMHYGPYFHPLDSIGHWNRLYGRRGFFQYQYVVPMQEGRATTRRILSLVSESGEASLLAVLKLFGDPESPGLLSFPMPGVTLAMDFPNRGRSTLALLDALDGIVDAAGGRVYPAKDARLSAASFRRGFPRWREFAEHVDPAFSSGFWRRMSQPEAS